MKILLLLYISLFLFSGCSISMFHLHSPHDKRILDKKEKRKQHAHKRVTHKNKKKHMKSSLKKKIILKKVEDKNYSAQYMYPQSKHIISKKETTMALKNVSTMTKETCVSIIGEEKFDIYTKKFGSEASTLKRCTMLSAMH